MEITGIRNVKEIDALIQEHYTNERPGSEALAQVRLPILAEWLGRDMDAGDRTTNAVGTDVRMEKATTIQALAERVARREDDDATLYRISIEGVLEVLAKAPAAAAATMTATGPPDADQPWDAAIAAGVEYSAQSAGRLAPAWCDESGRFASEPAIGASTAEEWAEALHGTAGAYIRHAVFPRPGAIEKATGRPRTALRGGSGSEPDEAMRAAAAAIERRLEADGLRGHVYMTRNTAIWFATTSHGRRRVLGPPAVAEAAARAIGSDEQPGEWLEKLAGTLRTDRWRPPRTWWDTRNLVITGTTPAVAAALATQFADEVDDETLERLTWVPKGRSVHGIDRIARAVSGRPASAASRERIARILKEPLATGETGWLERWIAAARKTLESGGDPRRLLVRNRKHGARWPWGPASTCGTHEANLDAVNPPACEQGRLWIRERRGERAGAALVLIDRNDSEIDIEIEDGEDAATGLLEAERARRRTPAADTTVWRQAERPGWKNIVGLAQYMAVEACPEGARRTLAGATVGNGRLQLRADDPPGETRGLLAAAEALSAETCELCGGKGDPIADDAGRAAGCRCGECRNGTTSVRARDWPAPTPDAAQTGVEKKEGREPECLETGYGEFMTRLMRGDEDEGRGMWLWTGLAGWGGLVRALFITLRPEQDERPDDPGHHPLRFGSMKEKWGMLRTENTPMNDYQRGVIRFIEMMSQWTCVDCGQPATMRYGKWIRPECDECWKGAEAEDRAEHVERMAERGYLGTVIGSHSYGGPFDLSIEVPTEPR